MDDYARRSRLKDMKAFNMLVEMAMSKIAESPEGQGFLSQLMTAVPQVIEIMRNLDEKLNLIQFSLNSIADRQRAQEMRLDAIVQYLMTRRDALVEPNPKELTHSPNLEELVHSIVNGQVKEGKQ